MVELAVSHEKSLTADDQHQPNVPITLSAYVLNRIKDTEQLMIVTQ